MRSCATNYALACGADDCRHCHPENYVGGRYMEPDATEEEWDAALAAEHYAMWGEEECGIFPRDRDDYEEHNDER